MGERVRIGIIGAGLIAQIKHIPNLLGLPEQFHIAGVCDPSPSVRKFVGEHFGVATFLDSDALLAEPLDAVLIAAPDFTHVPETLKALGAGLHVFCEKPLCYGPDDAADLIRARNAAGKVVQVGYMKRFDPAYEACLELLPQTADGLRMVSVEVHDPDAWPFIADHPHHFGNDITPAMIKAGNLARTEQIRRALGRTVPGEIETGFAATFCSSLVHDVNAVHGLLEHMGPVGGEVIGAGLLPGGQGGSATIRLPGGGAIWQMFHVVVPRLADYAERIGLYFDDRIIELAFPSPYLNNRPARLSVRSSTGHRLTTAEIRPGFGEAFVRELEGFWSSVTGAEPVRNTIEHAQRDQTLLCAMALRASLP